MRVSRKPYTIEASDLGPSSFSSLLIGCGLFVIAVGAGFAIGPGQFADDRDFFMSLALIFGGGAALTGGFMLGLAHAARPTVIHQPDEIRIDAPDAEARALHVDGRSFPLDQVRELRLQRQEVRHHDIHSSTTTITTYIVAIVLVRNVIELTFREQSDASRSAGELAEQLDTPTPRVTQRQTPAGPVVAGVVVILAAVAALFWATTVVLFADALNNLDILRAAGYVAALTPGTYVAARVAGRMTMGAWLSDVYGIHSTGPRLRRRASLLDRGGDLGIRPRRAPPPEPSSAALKGERAPAARSER